jgi:hypothetical protein
MVNELGDEWRAELLTKLLDAGGRGVATLILEPIATRVAPWWPEWVNAFTRIGGRADEWRFPIQLPDWLARLDRAAGLRHDELTARSIYVGSTASPTSLRDSEPQKTWSKTQRQRKRSREGHEDTKNNLRGFRFPLCL